MKSAQKAQSPLKMSFNRLKREQGSYRGESPQKFKNSSANIYSAVLSRHRCLDVNWGLKTPSFLHLTSSSFIPAANSEQQQAARHKRWSKTDVFGSGAASFAIILNKCALTSPTGNIAAIPWAVSVQQGKAIAQKENRIVVQEDGYYLVFGQVLGHCNSSLHHFDNTSDLFQRFSSYLRN